MWMWLVMLAVSAEVDGAATPRAYSEALQNALDVEADDRPEIDSVTFHGHAKGAPLLGTNAQATATVTCGERSVEVSVENVRGKSGEGSWFPTAKQVAERLLQDLDCAESNAPGKEVIEGSIPREDDQRPEEAVPQDDEAPAVAVRVDGFANPTALQDALFTALSTEVAGRPRIESIRFSASAKGSLQLGATVAATATITCDGTPHEVSVEQAKTKPLEGSWGPVALHVASRLVEQAACAD